MAFSKSFERELDRMFRKRTHWLRSKLGKTGAGKPPKFSRKNVNSGISNLQSIASRALADKLARSEFNKHISARKNYHINGRGVYDKKQKFEKWYSRNFPKSKGLIYVFWGEGKKCLYVGRTGLRGARPSAHFEKFWFSVVKRVTIFAVKGSSHIPKLECLAIHSFQPLRNKNKAATKKWTKACPLCTTHKYIENELRDIFRLRKTK